MSAEKRLHEKRHARVFAVCSALMRPVMRWLLNYHGEPIPNTDGPMLLLCNHNTDFDCILLGMAAPKLTYFVATESVTRMGLLSRIVMGGFDPILHVKGLQGAATTREMLGRIKAGYSVALFPEGNRSFDGLTCAIPSATGKVARISGATLVTYRLTGGYFTTPRWGRGIRKGRMDGHVMGIYTPEMLKGMKTAEIQAAIEKDLWTDAYAEQAEHPAGFRSRNGAEYLESMLFLCPECGGIGTLRSHKNELNCICGCRLTYTEYGFLRDGVGNERTITVLDRAQRLRLSELAGAAGDGPLFSDEVTLRRIGAAHAVESEERVTLCAYRNRIVAGEHIFRLDSLEGASIVQRNLLILHEDGGREHFECVGEAAFNALKYLYLIRNRDTLHQEDPEG